MRENPVKAMLDFLAALDDAKIFYRRMKNGDTCAATAPERTNR